MLRLALILGLATTLGGYAGSASLPASQEQTSEPEYQDIIFLLPTHFTGWACVDFGVAGAPALPREGNIWVARIRKGEVLATSDKRSGSSPPRGSLEIDGKRVPFSEGEFPHRSIQGERNGGVERECAFFGTVDDAEVAGDAPGFKSFPEPGVSDSERQALIALYRATNGEHWNHHVGWLGPAGTECRWHGVTCLQGHDGPSKVWRLDLQSNNLAGTIPQAMGQLPALDYLDFSDNHLSGAIPQTFGELTNLTELDLYGNRFSGLLPQAIIQRWLAGALAIGAEASLLTDISKIEFELDPSFWLCGRYVIAFDADGHSFRYETRCRDATPDDRTTFCEVKEGKVWPTAFATLAWLLEKNGFFALHPRYSRNITDATSENTRVTKNGKQYVVENYASAGPFELTVIQYAIEGVASSAQ